MADGLPPVDLAALAMIQMRVRNARGWRFGGVHKVSGAWSATPCRPSLSTVKSVRALSFAEFTFAFLEAVEKRELEIAQRAQARQASSAARSSLPEVAQ